jgi:hypothetical protein
MRLAFLLPLLLLPVALLLSGGFRPAPPASVFRRLHFDEVVAYDYDGHKGPDLLIVRADGQLASTVSARQVLSPVQVERLLQTLESRASYAAYGAACFEPHLGVVFYRQQRVVGHVSLCLSCHSLNSSLKIPARRLPGGEQAQGFSAAGLRPLEQLCQELSFGHCSSGEE